MNICFVEISSVGISGCFWCIYSEMMVKIVKKNYVQVRLWGVAHIDIHCCFLHCWKLCWIHVEHFHISCILLVSVFNFFLVSVPIVDSKIVLLFFFIGRVRLVRIAFIWNSIKNTNCMRSKFLRIFFLHFSTVCVCMCTLCVFSLLFRHFGTTWTFV